MLRLFRSLKKAVILFVACAAWSLFFGDRDPQIRQEGSNPITASANVPE